jgi:hypothetical protein
MVKCYISIALRRSVSLVRDSVIIQTQAEVGNCKMLETPALDY